jgi:hypothetical protein
MSNLFGSLDIEIWNLFVFWCLYFGICHYVRRAGWNLKPKPTLPMVIDIYHVLNIEQRPTMDRTIYV